MSARRRPIRCASGMAERVTQAGIGALLAAFALDSLDQPLLASATALGAALLVVGAIRGWCPGGLLAQRVAAAPWQEEQPADR